MLAFILDLVCEMTSLSILSSWMLSGSRPGSSATTALTLSWNLMHVGLVFYALDVTGLLFILLVLWLVLLEHQLLLWKGIRLELLAAGLSSAIVVVVAVAVVQVVAFVVGSCVHGHCRF